ncbi:MAG: DUF4386 domain-containing protein [Anaerolineaceae bacterium]
MDGNAGESMIRIANNPLLMRANILGEVITAAGIIFLGAVLFVILRKQNEKLALTALGLYILEAVLLAASRMEAFALLRISREYVTAGPSANLLTMGSLALESLSFEYNLAMMGFCTGAILFYYLLDKARIVPRVISLWGLISVIPLLIATVIVILGYEVSFYIYVPYIPFEFAIGIWILIKGIKTPSVAAGNIN